MRYRLAGAIGHGGSLAVRRSGGGAISSTGVGFIGRCVIAVTMLVGWRRTKAFLSLARRRSIAVAGVSWCDWPRRLIGCVVAGWCTLVDGIY